ncbi:MAG: S-layer homology domain-containing protein [Clostridia bacterium]|nr:S-layer homology domain-containing protein [Clostridia bacterium]
MAETRNLKSEDFSIMPRDYINEQTEWMPKEEVSQLLEAPMFASAESLSVIEPFTQSAEPEELEEIEQLEENISTQVMQSNVYPYSNQHLINTGDEMVMIWLDDNLERTSANRTQLKFSAFDGENWKQPQFINDDGTGDFEPVIAKTSNSVLMAWENINCICDDDVTLNEYISASEISVAQSVYSSPVSNWSDTITLTDDNYYDHSPSLVADENGGILVWVKDKANDMLGANPDSNDIMFSKWDGTSWSSPVVIVSNEDTIINSSAAYKDGEGVYSYTVDKDNNMQTTTDREIYVLTYNDEQWSNPVRMTDNNVEDSNPRPQYLKGEFFMTWYQEGNIVYVNDLQQEEPGIVDSLENAQVDYETAVSGNGQLSLVFAELAESGGRDIYTSIYDSENDIWSNKIRLTDDESFNRSYSPAFTDEGKLMVAYSRVELIKEIIDGEEYVNTGSADLSMVTLTPKHDLAVYADDISLSQQNPIPGCAVTVMATISNKGEFTENNIEVEFYDGNPLDEGIKIGDTQIVAQPISARGVSDVAVDWIVPDDMSTHTLYVTVDPQNSIYDIDTQNNTASLAVVQPDIEVTALDCQNVDTTRYLVTAHVANIGSIPVNGGDISLLVGDTEGEELESTETGMLASGDERAFEFMLDSGEMNFDEGDIDIVAQFTAEEGIEEFDIDNNLYYGAIERTPLVVDKVEPSADAEEVSINQQVTVGFNMDLTQDSDFAEIVLADTDNNVVATTKEIDGANVVLTPNSDLEYGKQYFVYIPVEAVTGSQQNKMEEAYRASFTTEEYRLNPVVRFTYPGELMDETPVDAKINVIFNETVAKGSSFNDISLQDGSGKEILNRVSINDKTLLVRLESDLEDSTNYTMTIPVNAVENTRGYSIEEDFVLEFSTRADSEDDGDDGDDGDDEDSEETGDSNGSSNNSGNSSGSTNVSGKVPIIQEQGVQGQGILSLNTPELLEKLETENENVEILVQNNQDASQVGLKIGKADVERCVTSNKGLIVNTGKVSILFSSKIMGQIAKDMGEEVTILIEKGLNQDTEAFSSYFGQAIESVYNITVNSSSNSSINLSNSSSSKVINKFAEDVMVSIKVDVSKIKDKRKVIVCVFDEETNDWKAVGGVLDLQTGKLNFNTGHFSKYSVFETNKEFDDLINRASKEQVEVLAARGIIFGKGDNKFVPDAVVTRAEFTSMAMRSLYVERTQSTGTYSDVPAGAWFTKEIETASELGLIYGTGNSLFEPNRKITREELATIACRIYTYKKGVDLPEEQGILFDDKNDISPYARQSVEFLSSKGIIFGSNNKFYPKREASREEAAVILCRLLSCVGEI